MVKYIKKEGIYQPQRGEAYAFFDCNAPKDKIDAYLQGRLPEVSGEECRHDHPKPHELGLELKLENVSDLLGRKDADIDLRGTVRKEAVYSTYPRAYRHLMKTAKPVPLKNMRYVITARNNKTNADVCKRLTTVMNDVYLKFGEKKPFTVAIIGKDNSGEYKLWEDKQASFYEELLRRYCNNLN
jgi:hypothetical protein